MGVAYYIALDVEDPDFDAMLDGKTIARSEALLNALAKSDGLPDIMSFFGMDGDELGDMLGEDDITDAGEWHDAAAGSAYFARLAELVSQQPDAARHRELIAELAEFSAVLDQAQTSGARWRLAIDI